MRISSLPDLALLAGGAGACLYFFSRVHDVVFLSGFGLGAGVMPVTAPDAIVDGLSGFVLTLLYLVVPVASAYLLYAGLVIVVRAWPLARKAPAPSKVETSSSGIAGFLQRVRSDPRNPPLFTALLLLLAVPFCFVVCVAAVAISAEMAARRNIREAANSVGGTCTKCLIYTVGKRKVIGRPIGSTPERLFVLGPGRSVTPLRIDEVDEIAPARSDISQGTKTTAPLRRRGERVSSSPPPA